jgi:uncharacterized DUF497 family protein
MPQEREPELTFEWDKSKNRANIGKHGFDFADAAELFGHPLLARPDTREDYSEERWSGLAWYAAGLL